MTDKQEQEAIGIGIAIIIVLAAAITVSKTLFPYFALGTAITFVLLVVSAVFYTRDEYPDNTWVLIFVVGFLCCFVGTLITYGIGYGFGESDLGHAVTDIANAFNLANKAKTDAENMAIEAVQNATNEIMQSMNTSEVHE